MIVALSPFDVHLAVFVANCRTVSALRDRRPLENGRADLAFERDVRGALGEYATAIALDRCWRPAVGRLDTRTGDVGDIHVKATGRDNGSLIVRTQDPETFRYVLAIVRRTARGVDVELAGWIAGTDAKQPCYWRDVDQARGIHQAAFFVPQSALGPLEAAA